MHHRLSALGLLIFQCLWFSLTASTFTLNSGIVGTFNQEGTGSISVTSSPESGVMIFLNDKSTGKTTPSTLGGLSPGQYSVKVVGQWYRAQDMSVTVIEGQTASARFTLVPNYADITVNTSFDGAIYVDGVRKGTTTWTGRVQEGERKFRVDKDDMVAREQKALVVRGKEMKIDLMMRPKTGGLELITQPTGAMIDIGGRLYGLTPSHITELLPGEYSLTLSKPGYTTVIRRFKIVDGQTTTIDIKLYKGKEISIITDPPGADVIMGDSIIGTTPFKSILDFGDNIVKIVKGGYTTVETITVTPTGQAAFTFKLKESNDPFEKQMVLVKGGTFKMGDTFGDGKKEEKPVRSVTVDDFYISKFEITQEQWREMMGASPSHYSGCDKCPVERVSWHEVQEFIKKLNLLTGKKYRLPTEAEWEYAARGGEKTRGLRYAGHNNINFVSWYTVNSGSKTQPVGQLQPNELGLYDMSGNVWEWCNDWAGDYPNRPEFNPQGPGSGELKVVRGGSWFGYIAGNRVCSRGFDDPSNGRSYIGFRLVLTP